MKQFLLGLVIGAVGVFFYLQGDLPFMSGSDDNKMIAEYYENSTATLVSPHSVREKMAHGTDTGIILVDVRAEEDYLREHVVTAINIDTGRPLEMVLEDFESLVYGNPDKEIIIYCYSAACMNGRKAGNFLAENGIYVKEMTIGWNEWRHGWQMWNYDTEWDTYKVEDFTATGEEPGVVPLSAKTLKQCGVSGELSC